MRKFITFIFLFVISLPCAQAATYDLGTDKSALSQLKQSKNAPLLSDYIDFFGARVLYHDKKYQKALDKVPAIQKSPVKKIEWERFWLRMHLLALLQQNSTLEMEIHLIKKANPKNKTVITKSEFYLGVAKLLIRQKTAALAHFAKILIENPGSEYDQKIFNILEANGIATDSVLSKYQWNKRAENLADTGFAHKATLIWENILKDKEKVAFGTFKEKKYKEAAKLYENLWHSKNHQASDIEILTTLAKAQARSDDFDGAIKTNNLIKEKYPHTRAAVDANFKLGFLYFDSKQYDKAVSYLEKFLKNGSAYQKEQARWYRLWSFYLSRKYERALEELVAYSQERRQNKDSTRMLNYWQARIYEQMGKKEEAQKIYRDISSTDILEFHSLLARQRLQRQFLEPVTVFSNKTFSFLPDHKEEQSPPPRPNLNILDPNDSLIKAITLSKIGLDDFAYNETLYSKHISETPTYNVLYALVLAGNFTKGYAIRRVAMGGKIPNIDSLAAYRLAFPEAYAKYVEPDTKLWSSDKYLTYAVMRQESSFIPEIMSQAFAYGLMQIIPSTGEEIAKKIGFPNFEASLLNQPRVNILFGTYYLGYLLKTFDNQLVYAMASYNAGPYAVGRWVTNIGQLEKDEFIELIPYKETKKYVQKVLVNYMVYKSIYP